MNSVIIFWEIGVTFFLFVYETNLGVICARSPTQLVAGLQHDGKDMYPIYAKQLVFVQLNLIMLNKVSRNTFIIAINIAELSCLLFSRCF